MNYICHSGGCPGADMCWENEGDKYGVKTIAYSFGGHKQEGKNRVILSTEELNEGFEHVLIANKTIKRYPQGQARYIQNLLARNWFQVKNAESVFAISKKFSNVEHTLVDGGTGWAVQMAIDNKKPVYVFDQPTISWFYYDYIRGIFCKYSEFPLTDMRTTDMRILLLIPKLTENFAGVGTREINEYGKRAIEEILKHNLSRSEEEQPVKPVNPATL